MGPAGPIFFGYKYCMVRFIYAGDKYSKEREQVVEHICTIVSALIELPQVVEVEFAKLRGSVYGETILDTRFRGRFRLSEDLTPKESIRPTVHELLHLNQIHLGKLSARRDGIYVWNKRTYNVKTGEMTAIEWANLPWEIDVANNQQVILEQVLRIGNR